MFAARKPGRPRVSPYLQWLHAMQTTVWFAFIAASGVNYKAIRIRYTPGRRSKKQSINRHYGDRDRQWHRWSHGSGPVKPEVLHIVEDRVPGSMHTYIYGPEGSRIWPSLDPMSHLQRELGFFSQPGLHSPDPLLNSRELMASPWHRVTFRILTYRLRHENTLQPRLPGDHALLPETAGHSFNTARQALLEMLDIEKAALAAYSLHPQDFLYLLEPERFGNTGVPVKFQRRERHPAWREQDTVSRKPVQK